MPDLLWRDVEMGSARRSSAAPVVTERAGVYVSIQRGRLDRATAEIMADAQLLDTLRRRRAQGFEGGVWADELDSADIPWDDD